MLRKISSPANADFCIYQDVESLDVFFDIRAVETIGEIDVDVMNLAGSFDYYRDTTKAEEVVSITGLFEILMLYNEGVAINILKGHFGALVDYWRNFPH
jgi:hypothetical protein